MLNSSQCAYRGLYFAYKSRAQLPYWEIRLRNHLRAIELILIRQAEAAALLHNLNLVGADMHQSWPKLAVPQRP